MTDDELKKAHDDGQKALRDAFAAETPQGAIDGIIAFGRALSALAREAAIKKRERRLAKRRQRYALRKRLGIEPKPKPAPEPERDYERPTSCYCSATSHPPCGWCEGGGGCCTECGEEIGDDERDGENGPICSACDDRHSERGQGAE